MERSMYSKIVSWLSILLLTVSIPLFADTDGSVFLSLTRKVSKLKDMPTNVSVIPFEKIQESKAKTAAEVLQNSASLNVGSYGTLGANQNIIIRGAAPEEVLVLIDGRRANDPAMGLIDLSTLPAENIERVEIIRGGASAIYGTGALGGVVNIITRKPQLETPKTNIGFSMGSFNTQKTGVDFEIKREKTYGFLSAARTLSDGWRQNSGFDGSNFFARMGYDAGSAGQIDLSGAYSRSDAGVPGMGIPLAQYDGSAEKLASTPDANQKVNKSFGRIDHTVNLGEDTFKTSFHASQDITFYKVPAWLQDDEYKSFSFGGETQYQSSLGLTTGFEWYEELYKQYDNTMSALETDRSRVSANIFAQQEIRIANLSVIPSARYDNNSVFGSVFSPSIGLVYQANELLKISANSGKAWRAPTLNELYWPNETSSFWGTTYITQGNATLKPEEGVASDFGVEYGSNKFSNKVTLFYTESRDLISWQQTTDPVSNSVTTMPQNIGRAKSQGLEYELGHKIADGLYQTINYTHTWAIDADSLQVLPYRSPNIINYDLSYIAPWNMKLNINGKYVSATPVSGVNSLPDYTLVGLKVSQKIAELELWVGIDNLLDKMYQSRINYPLPGRSYNFGLSLRFID
ncbi:MAG TPA: hypothetical protein DEE98_02540 [Elusimicrobia bacterium]|nr:hypothetical protein [Elusimicrobiota bacterium]